MHAATSVPARCSIAASSTSVRCKSSCTARGASGHSPSASACTHVRTHRTRCSALGVAAAVCAGAQRSSDVAHGGREGVGGRPLRHFARHLDQVSRGLLHDHPVVALVGAGRNPVLCVRACVRERDCQLATNARAGTQPQLATYVIQIHQPAEARVAMAAAALPAVLRPARGNTGGRSARAQAPAPHLNALRGQPRDERLQPAARGVHLHAQASVTHGRTSRPGAARTSGSALRSSCCSCFCSRWYSCMTGARM